MSGPRSARRPRRSPQAPPLQAPLGSSRWRPRTTPRRAPRRVLRAPPRPAFASTRAPGSRRRTASAAWRLRTGVRRVSYVSAEVGLPTSRHTEARPRNRPPRWGRGRRAPTGGSWPPRESTHRAGSRAAPRLSRSGSTSRESRLSASPPAQTARFARPRPSAEGALPAPCPGSGSAASRLSESPCYPVVLKSREVLFAAFFLVLERFPPSGWGRRDGSAR